MEVTEAEKYYKKMTETPLTKLVISLGIPTTISMLITSVYNMVDTYFVGTLGESQQAATGILFTLQAIIQAISFMLGQGSGSMVSRALADKNTEEASEYVSTAFYTGALAGSVLMIFGFLFLDPFMRLLGSTETILPYARQYGACVLITCPIVVCSFVLNNNLRYEGKAFYAMIGLGIGGVLNIFIDYLLVMVFSMGVLGAGIATGVSQFISFCILLHFYKKKAQGTISLRYVSRELQIYLTIGRVGFPALIRQGLSSFSNGLLNNLTRPYGDAAIAAMSVVNRFSAFVMCVGLGIGQGFQPVAAFNYQAKKIKRVKKALLVTMTIGFCMICVAAIPGFFFAEQIVYLFQKSEAVAEIGTFALRCACIGAMCLPLSVPINMLYQSTGMAGLSSLLSMLRSGLMFIPTLIITTNLLGLTGIQISQPFADVATGIICLPFIISAFRWKDETEENEVGK